VAKPAILHAKGKPEMRARGFYGVHWGLMSRSEPLVNTARNINLDRRSQITECQTTVLNAIVGYIGYQWKTKFYYFNEHFHGPAPVLSRHFGQWHCEEYRVLTKVVPVYQSNDSGVRSTYNLH
jgi:hypothetical protein